MRPLALRASEALKRIREGEVLHALGEGMSNEAIAERLGVGRGTVAAHLQHILGKTGAANRVEAVAIARRLGLLG